MWNGRSSFRCCIGCLLLLAFAKFMYTVWWTRTNVPFNNKIDVDFDVKSKLATNLALYKPSKVILENHQYLGNFTVMTFNTWNSGDNVQNGLAKIATAINTYHPDIVSLQEMQEGKIVKLLKLLKSDWQRCSQRSGYVVTITRWKVIKTYQPVAEFYNQGCKIRLITANSTEHFVNVWNIHLPYKHLGFEKACSVGEFATVKAVLLDDLYVCERNKSNKYVSRLESIQLLFEHKTFQENLRSALSNHESLMLMGDFNTASHLDWIDSTASDHCNWTVVWPVTELCQKMGLVDSFRELNPSPSTAPAKTLMFVPKVNLVEDRIDFLYYYPNSLIKPAKSFIVGESPHKKFSKWPSDHKAVVTVFKYSVF